MITPLDVARRTAKSPLTPVPPAPAPVALFSSDPTRTTGLPAQRIDYERGIRGSQLPANARLVALVLCAYADFTTGELGARTPTIDRITHSSGLDQRFVVRSLNELERCGYITRARDRAETQRRVRPITLTLPQLTAAH